MWWHIVSIAAAAIISWAVTNAIRDKEKKKILKALDAARKRPVIIHKESADVVKLEAKTFIPNELFRADPVAAAKRMRRDLCEKIGRSVFSMCEFTVADEPERCGQVLRARLRVIPSNDPPKHISQLFQNTSQKDRKEYQHGKERKAQEGDARSLQ